MESEERTGARLAAVTVLGVLLFHPLAIKLFGADPHLTVSGVPTFYIYLFATWGAVIAMLAVIIRLHHRASAMERADDSVAGATEARNSDMRP